MPEANLPKRTAKDTVFNDMFSQKPFLLQLYRTLHPEDTAVTEDDLTNINIASVIADGIYNDLGFRVADRLIILAESQSTWTTNILVRSLIYLAQTYQEYFRANNVSLYTSKQVHLPKPELYMVYTKERSGRPDQLDLREVFFPGQECCLDAKIKVLYDDGSDSIISQYIRFCTVLDAQIKLHGRTNEAITETLRICRDRNLLTTYLKGREVEVAGMMNSLFDQDWETERYGDRRAEEGRQEGRREGRLQTVRDMIKAKLTTFEAVKASNLYTPQELEIIGAV